jgi:hypothetical protein
MKKNLLSLFLVLPVFIKAQILMINTADSSYIVRERNLTASNKNCLIFNCIKKDYFMEEEVPIKPLILIKIFNYENKKKITLSERPLRYVSFADYIQATVLPKLKVDMLLKIESLGSAFHGTNINLFDSLVLYDGENYYLLQGIIETDFYNLVDFAQKNISQSNQTIINTKAKIAKVTGWLKDSIPDINVDPADLFPKMYLIRKEKDNYTFFTYPRHDEDSPLDFYREFVYKKSYGIIAFRSKYLYRSKGQIRPNVLASSDEYYYFR